MKFLKRLFCKHEYELLEPAYGDMKNVYSGYCKCKKCGKEGLR